LKGLFTKEIQDALLSGTIDAAVHSLKDLPGVTPASLGLAAVLPRADASDLLISTVHAGLESLANGARIGTGSVRRQRQIEWLRPGLEVVGLRGNVPTRLAKLTALSLDAIILAHAGLERLGYGLAHGRLHCDAGDFHASKLAILPAIGQGAIGLEIRRDDDATRAIVRAIDDAPSHTCIRVERELLRLLNGDCRLPVGARATLDGSGILHAEAIVFHDASPPARAAASGPATDPEALAHDLFQKLSK
jgi:hydroxymethylbilane synthase